MIRINLEKDIQYQDAKSFYINIVYPFLLKRINYTILSFYSSNPNHSVFKEASKKIKNKKINKSNIKYIFDNELGGIVAENYSKINTSKYSQSKNTKKKKKITSRDLTFLSNLKDDLLSIIDFKFESEKTKSETSSDIKLKTLLEKYKNKNTKLNTILDYNQLHGGISFDSKKIYPLYEVGVKLGLRTCPYCNKNYILTIKDLENKEENVKLVNATFDHWLSKDIYPLFQLSFYNLIPSCSDCNSSIKKEKIFSLQTHIHPYTVKDDITEDYRFNYYEDKNKKPIVYIDYISTDFELIKKLRHTFSDFKTEKIYGALMLEIEEMRELAEAYDENYIDSLQDLFSESNFTNEKIYNLLFHTSELDENHHLRPLSKFRLDILKKLNVI